MVNKEVPVKSIAELIALAMKEPGRLTHPSGGSATLLSLELFKAAAGIDIRSIPFALAGTPRTVVEVIESAIKEDCVDAGGARTVRSNWSQCAKRQC